MIDYEPIGWIDRETARTTPTSAANFNHMDEGIEQATNFANETREKVDELESRQSIQEARMDTIASLPSGSISTKGDAELNDIRSGYDGSVYTTAGNAVRGQAKTLQGYIDALEAANAVLSGQIENLVQTSSEATVGNEELIDIRTGYDGTVYNTAGTAVREQISAVITKVENTDNTKTVTQEEYDALSEEEKTNGTIYFITDGGGVRQAATVEYDNERSGLTGATVQAAIDEAAEVVATMRETDTSLQSQITALNSSLTPKSYTGYSFSAYSAVDIGLSYVYIIGKICIFSLAFVYTSDYTPAATQIFVNGMPKPAHDSYLQGMSFNGSSMEPFRCRVYANGNTGSISNYYSGMKTYANVPSIITGVYVIA